MGRSLVQSNPVKLRLPTALRVLEVTKIKTVPYVPLSHPFVERLIGTVRRKFLDQTLFWTTADLETKLVDFQHYYDGHRTHAGLDGRPPEPSLGEFARDRCRSSCLLRRTNIHGLRTLLSLFGVVLYVVAFLQGPQAARLNRRLMHK